MDGTFVQRTYIYSVVRLEIKDEESCLNAEVELDLAVDEGPCGGATRWW